MNGMIFDARFIGPWVCARAGGIWTPGRGTAIGRMKDGRLVGGILYEDFNGANIICHIAGEGHYWLDRTFLWMIFDYPFRQLGVRRMTAPVASSNAACINFVQRLGFEREAILHDAHPDGDILVFKMTAENCRWLECFNGKRQHTQGA